MPVKKVKHDNPTHHENRIIEVDVIQMLSIR